MIKKPEHCKSFIEIRLLDIFYTSTGLKAPLRHTRGIEHWENRGEKEEFVYLINPKKLEIFPLANHRNIFCLPTEGHQNLCKKIILKVIVAHHQTPDKIGQRPQEIFEHFIIYRGLLNSF